VPTKYGNYSIANLGYSSIQCKSVPFNMHTMILSCPFGNITDISDNVMNKPETGKAFGVNPASSAIRDYCVRNDEFNNRECSS
jgi:hypothetical protein